MQARSFTDNNDSRIIHYYRSGGKVYPGKNYGKDNVLFVFGSDLRGRHGAGAAKTALRHYGAAEGCGIGLSGKSYAIPTKDVNIQPLPLDLIEQYVEEFVNFTKNNLQYSFLITPLGTGLAGYSHEQIAPMFKGVHNAWVTQDWMPYLAGSIG